jgi:hypothetical protein
MTIPVMDGHVFVLDKPMRAQPVARLVVSNRIGVMDPPGRAAHAARMMGELTCAIAFSRPKPPDAALALASLPDIRIEMSRRVERRHDLVAAAGAPIGKIPVAGQVQNDALKHDVRLHDWKHIDSTLAQVLDCKLISIKFERRSMLALE